MKKHLFYITTTALLLLAGLLVWKNAQKDESVLISEETNPLKIIDCELDPKFNYWSYWKKDYDYSSHAYEETKNKRQGNFYISCRAEGTAGMMNAYIFKDYQLLFKIENIYQGQFFKSNNDDFYVIQGIMNPEVNAYPLGYVSTRYEFDLSKNILVEKETKEYKTKEELENLYQFEKENNINFEDDAYYNLLLN